MTDRMPEPAADDQSASLATFRDAVWAGLDQAPKTLPTAYLYDATGSALFEQITALDAYYPTRTEIGILTRIAPDWVRNLPAGSVLVEFGSGSSVKTEILLNAGPQITTYAPIDVSAAALDEAASRLAARFPALDIRPVIGDFTNVRLPDDLAQRAHAGFFPGSTIGNFTPAQASGLLMAFARLLGPGAAMLIGVDLAKDEARLKHAYDDPDGVTAAFNLNLLKRINRELDGDFDLGQFRHIARVNTDKSRVEMHLLSCHPQTVTVAGRTFAFAEGETIHTENSHKFTIAGFQALARETGWTCRATHCDADDLFSVHDLVC